MRDRTEIHGERREKKDDPIMALPEYQKKWDCANDDGDYVLCTPGRLRRGSLHVLLPALGWRGAAIQ